MQLEQSLFLECVGNIIKKTRKSRNMTLEQLAELSGIDYTTLTNIENAKQNPKLYTIYKLFLALEINLITFLEQDDIHLVHKKNASIRKLEMLDAQTLDIVNELISTYCITKR